MRLPTFRPALGVILSTYHGRWRGPRGFCEFLRSDRHKEPPAQVNRELRTILAILAGAAVVVIVVLALTGGGTETTVLPPVELPPPGAVGPTGTPIAVVVSTHEDQEASWFGLRRGRTHYLVSVQFYAPPECSPLLSDGDPWPASAAECSTTVPISGVVTGTGIAPTGETIVVVDAEVQEECFVAMAPGDTWPLTRPECG